MPHKRIYKCIQDQATGSSAIKVADENGKIIVNSVFKDFDETLAYFHEIKDELAKNKKLEIIEINDFHFECRNVELLSNS